MARFLGLTGYRKRARRGRLAAAVALAALLAGCAANGNGGRDTPAAGGLTVTLKPVPGSPAFAPPATRPVALTDSANLFVEAQFAQAGERFRALPVAAPVLHLKLSALSEDGTVDEALVRAARAAGGGDPVYPVQASIELPSPSPVAAPRAPQTGGPPAADERIDPYAWRDPAGGTEEAAPAAAPLRRYACGVEAAVYEGEGILPAAWFRVFHDLNGDGARDADEPVLVNRLVFANEIRPAIDLPGAPPDDDGDGIPDALRP